MTYGEQQRARLATLHRIQAQYARYGYTPRDVSGAKRARAGTIRRLDAEIERARREGRAAYEEWRREGEGSKIPEIQERAERQLQGLFAEMQAIKAEAQSRSRHPLAQAMIDDSFIAVKKAIEKGYRRAIGQMYTGNFDAIEKFIDKTQDISLEMQGMVRRLINAAYDPDLNDLSVTQSTRYERYRDMLLTVVKMLGLETEVGVSTMFSPI